MIFNQMNRKQKIIAVSTVAFLFSVLVFGVIYFVFIKPIPKGVTLSPDQVKAKKLETIFIKGTYKHLGEPVELELDNVNSTTSRDSFINNIINNKEGCFSFPENPYFQGKPIFITEVRLPSDIRATAWGKQVDQAGPCKFIKKEDIKPGGKAQFGSDTVYGLKFTRA